MSKKDSTSFGSYTRQVASVMTLLCAIICYLILLPLAISYSSAIGETVTLHNWAEMIAVLGILTVVLASVTSILLLPFYPIYAAGHRGLTNAGIAVAALSFFAGVMTAMLGAWG